MNLQKTENDLFHVYIEDKQNWPNHYTVVHLKSDAVVTVIATNENDAIRVAKLFI